MALNNNPNRELVIAINKFSPECPMCGHIHYGGFHMSEPPQGYCCPFLVKWKGTIKCEGCAKFFSATHYTDDEVHSTAYKRKVGAHD